MLRLLLLTLLRRPPLIRVVCHCAFAFEPFPPFGGCCRRILDPRLCSSRVLGCLMVEWIVGPDRYASNWLEGMYGVLSGPAMGPASRAAGAGRGMANFECLYARFRCVLVSRWAGGWSKKVDPG
jgi:hypothetical protein